MKPRVLFYDIETSPNLGYSWGKWEQNIIAFKKEWELLSFAYKWKGEKKVHCLTRKDYPSEKALVREMWKIHNEADIVIAHNGDAFDQKKLKAKYVQHGFNPPQPAKTIDTLKIARANFAFNSNKLDDLGNILGLGRKEQTGGFQLWLDCMSGIKKAWAKMAKYNKQDVVLLERVYMKLRSWMPNHPNLNLYKEEDDRGACPVCQSTKVQAQGIRVAVKTRKQRFQCQACGHWFTGKALKSEKK